MKRLPVAAALVFLAFTTLVSGQSPAAGNSAAPALPAMKSWFIRLIPPRPTFAQDATAAEKALMERHFAYWKDLNAKGVCVFGGPVLDPRGVYGILVVRTATEEEARALGNGDPSVKAGVNKIEVAEMRVVFVPRASAL